jgi:hypothetical protein
LSEATCNFGTGAFTWTTNSWTDLNVDRSTFSMIKKSEEHCVFLMISALAYSPFSWARMLRIKVGTKITA